VDIGEKVLEGLATLDKTTIVIERQPDGKMRITSGSWDGQKIFLKDQVIEVRHANADGRLHVARKTKDPNEWDPRLPVYDPYGPGVSGDDDGDAVTTLTAAFVAAALLVVGSAVWAFWLDPDKHILSS
jgi:hypothetical protein